MGAYLLYTNKSGEKSERIWVSDQEKKFPALIKCYVQQDGKLKVIEKPSTRPATFKECRRYVEKLKREFGRSLMQLSVWNMDEWKDFI